MNRRLGFAVAMAQAVFNIGAGGKEKISPKARVRGSYGKRTVNNRWNLRQPACGTFAGLSGKSTPIAGFERQGPKTEVED